MSTVIVTSVWGREYLDFYLQHVLPYTRKILPDGFKISCATLAEHVDELCEVADFVMSAESHAIDMIGLTALLDKVQVQNLYNLGARKFVFQNPDVVISQSALLRARDTDKKIITAPGIRIAKEEFLAIYGGLDDELLPNALSTLHPITLSLCRRGGYRRFSSGWPSVVYEVDADAVSCRALHRHPLMVTIPDNFDWSLVPNGTVDDRFMQSLGWDWSEYDNLTSSKQGWICEFSSARKPLQSPLEANADINQRIAQFAASACCDDTHRKFYEQDYTWHRQ